METNSQISFIEKGGAYCSVRVKDANGREAQGEVYIQVWDQKKRTARALKTLGLCWGLALITVVVPILHFILVPGFFVAGPAAAWIIYQQSSIVLGGATTCPKCKEAFKIERGREKWPLEDVCSKCYQAVFIERV